MSPQTILTDNIQALASAARILKRLSHEQYSQVSTPYFSASVGKHFRHILDHYLSFIKGLSNSQVDYDQRGRNTHIETDLEYALNTLEQVINALSTLSQQADLTTTKKELLRVTLCTSCSDEITEPAISSVHRELVFLQGHTIHHYAIIAAILKFKGVAVDPDFGVAASTLKYQEQSQCAH